MKKKKILGIDVGGSGIKGSIVNTKSGKLETERHRIPTPLPATPETVAKTITEIADHFKWDGAIGCGFPAVVQNGIAKTAANIDPSFIGTNIDELFSKITERPCFAVNDADSAGMAEMKFGAGKGHKGTVILITVGTGIGTVIFSQDKLLKNTELGHIILNGMDAEKYASDAARKEFDLSWEDWALRFKEYLKYMEFLFWPDLFIIGGGVSKKMDKFKEIINLDTNILPAELRNEAGIVGAALYAKTQLPN